MTDQNLIKKLSREQVYQASQHGQTLTVIANKIYDLTSWINRHPGGKLALQHVNGKDATQLFLGMHSKYARDVLLQRFYYGEITDQPSQMITEFEQMRQEIEARGLTEFKAEYFFGKLALYLSMLGVVIALVLQSDSFAVHMFAAVLLGIYYQQMAFLGHDSGHNGICENILVNRVYGLFVGNFFTGISLAWWRRNHNIHHIVTNSIDDDPDIQHLPIFAVTPVFMERQVWSSFYKRHLHRNKLALLLVQYQHYLYYVVMLIARFNLYIQSILLVLSIGMYSPAKSKGEKIWRRDLELYSVLGYYVWFSVFLSCLPSIQTRICFVLLSHAIAGLLHVQITLSHFSMPCFTKEEDTESYLEDDFIKKQLSGSLDIDCPLVLDWFHGGLQYQVEHHLFPRLPRHNLRTIKKLLVPFCEKHNLSYHSTSFFDGNVRIIDTLKRTAEETKRMSPMLWNLLNAHG